jgi:hypothetical protein
MLGTNRLRILFNGVTALTVSNDNTIVSPTIANPTFTGTPTNLNYVPLTNGTSTGQTLSGAMFSTALTNLTLNATNPAVTFINSSTADSNNAAVLNGNLRINGNAGIIVTNTGYGGGANTYTFVQVGSGSAGFSLKVGSHSFTITRADNAAIADFDISSAIFPGSMTANFFVSSASNTLAPSSITFPATTVNWTNTFGKNIFVFIDNAGVTGTVIKINGTQIASTLMTTGVATIPLQPNEFFSETYTIGTPTAKWKPQ